MSMESHGGMILTGETEELWEKPVAMPLFHQKYHTDWSEHEPVPLQWEAGKWPPEPWHGNSKTYCYEI
jgi:hypothetical protein